MDAVCYIPSAFCPLSILVNVAMAFIVMAPFAATRLLVLRMRVHSVGKLQPAWRASLFTTSGMPRSAA